jgi:hypothetical protein
MVRTCSTKGAKRNAYGILVGEPEGKRLLGRPRCRWMNNIKIDLTQEIRWDDMVWAGLMWLRIETNGSCEHGNEPSGSVTCWEVFE